MIGKSFRKQAVWFFATGFGLGHFPVASGTVGTLPALPLVWWFWTRPAFSTYPVGILWQILLSVGLCMLAVPVCGLAEKDFGTKDDGRIVADEYLTFPLCMIGLPWTPWVALTAFLSCRFFDILKPPPADRLQRLKGGTGIVIDDVVAALYALGVNHLVYWLFLHRFLH